MQIDKESIYNCIFIGVVVGALVWYFLDRDNEKDESSGKGPSSAALLLMSKKEKKKKDEDDEDEDETCSNKTCASSNNITPGSAGSGLSKTKSMLIPGRR